MCVKLFYSSFTGLEVYKQMFGMKSSGLGNWQEGNSMWEFSLGGRKAGSGAVGVVLMPPKCWLFPQRDEEIQEFLGRG